MSETSEKVYRIKESTLQGFAEQTRRLACIEEKMCPPDMLQCLEGVIPGTGGGGGENSEQMPPEIFVSEDGLITATANGKSSTKQLPTQSGKTVIPKTSEQIAVAAGNYVTGDVKVAAVEGGASEPFCQVIAESQNPSIVNVFANILTETLISFKKYPVLTSACYTGTTDSPTGIVEASAGTWVLATISIRSDVTYPDDWTLLHETESVTSSSGTKQKMAFLCKYVESAESVSFTATLSTSVRWYVNLIAVAGTNGFKYNEGTERCFNTAAASFTVVKPDCAFVLWGCSAIAWSSSGGQWSCSQIAVPVIDLGSSTSSRQGNFLDNGAPTERIFNAVTSSTVAIIDCVEVLM